LSSTSVTGLAGRHPNRQIVAGQGQAMPDDSGNPVVEVGQAGMADRQRPLAAHMRPAVQQQDWAAHLRHQRQRQDHHAGHQDRQGDPEPPGQPPQDYDGQQEGGQLDPPGPQRTTHHQQHAGRRGHVDRRAEGGWCGVDDRGQPDPAQEVPHRLPRRGLVEGVLELVEELADEPQDQVGHEHGDEDDDQEQHGPCPHEMTSANCREGRARSVRGNRARPASS
jgi:hypothetical protein